LSIELRRRHGSPYWYMRGSVRGLRIDESTGLGDRKAAQEILALREAELVRQSVHGAPAVKTFAHAAASYMESGGEADHLTPLIEFFGLTKLGQIDADMIDRAAKKLARMKGGKAKAPATMNRQVYTPIAAVLHHAAQKGWCHKPVIARPKQPEGRVRWITHDEAEKMISAAADHLRPLVVFLLSTGARLSEALYLDWRNIDLEAGRVAFLDTKNGESRGVPLHSKAAAQLRLMPHREGAVFRRPDGQPYADREGLGGGQVKTAWKTMLKNAGIKDFTPHDCRHTWASWHYAANRDMLGLMRLGGWKSEKMVARYAHLNPDDLAPTIDLVWGKSGGAKNKTSKKNNHLKEVA
jgi:integrase